MKKKKKKTTKTNGVWATQWAYQVTKVLTQKAKEHASNFLLNNLMPSKMGSMDHGESFLLLSLALFLSYTFPYHIELLLASGNRVGPPYECQGNGPEPWSFWHTKYVPKCTPRTRPGSNTCQAWWSILDILGLCILVQETQLYYSVCMPNSNS